MSVDIVPTRTLVPLAVEWLEMLPPVLAGDAWIQAIYNALAREFQRLLDQAEAVGEGLVPTTANQYTLPIWEALLGLPVSPEGRSVEQRRESVLAAMLRGDGSGAEWERSMAAVTRNSYRYTEYDSGDPGVGRYSLLMNTSLPSGTTIEGLRQFVREITPANLHVDIVGGNTYANVKATQADYTATRVAYPNYDNMRYGTV